MDDTTSDSTATSPVAGPFMVAAGAAAVGSILLTILQDMNLKREIGMAINNFTDNNLTNPQTYIESGKTVDVALEIPDGKASFVSAGKTSGPVATGSVGVITYEIENTTYRLAILWSVPWDYNFYENRLYFEIRDADKPTDAHLYNEMYKNSAKAKDGTFKVDDRVKGFRVIGVMGTGGQATLNIAFKPLADGDS